MIRLRVFVSSTQKELKAERQAIGSLLATDEFLRSCTVPRLFEEYPAPLQPNPKAYLDLLSTCHVYLLVVGREYGRVLDDGLSATHQEYRFARARKMPTMVCVRGERAEPREDGTHAFLAEVEADHHTYSRFGNIDELLDKVRDRLRSRPARGRRKRRVRSRSTTRRLSSGSLTRLDRSRPRPVFRSWAFRAIRLGAFFQAWSSRGFSKRLEPAGVPGTGEGPSDEATAD